MDKCNYQKYFENSRRNNKLFAKYADAKVAEQAEYLSSIEDDDSRETEREYIFDTAYFEAAVQSCCTDLEPIILDSRIVIGMARTKHYQSLLNDILDFKPDCIICSPTIVSIIRMSKMLKETSAVINGPYILGTLTYKEIPVLVTSSAEYGQFFLIKNGKINQYGKVINI